MKLFKTMIAGTLLFCAVNGTTFAADNESAKVKASPKPKTTPTSSALPADRTIEFRVGPRGSFLTGDVRVGKTGSTVDVYDDLGMDEPSAGTQLDLDIQPFNTWQPWGWRLLDRLHLSFGFTYDAYDHSGTTKKDILTDRGDTVLAGARVNSDFDAYSCEFKLGYDICSNQNLRIQPYVGGKWAEVTGSVSLSGSVTTAAPGSVTRSGSRSATYENDEATFLGGVDSRVYLTRSWYLGGDISGFAYDHWSFVTGDAYMGYDFDKNVGIRAGYSFDYVDYSNPNDSVKLSPLLGAIYIQGVVGF